MNSQPRLIKPNMNKKKETIEVIKTEAAKAPFKLKAEVSMKVPNPITNKNTKPIEPLVTWLA